MPSYAHAKVRFCTTETVDVEGAMLEETMEPLERAMIARQCCIRFAIAVRKKDGQIVVGAKVLDHSTKRRIPKIFDQQHAHQLVTHHNLGPEQH